MLINGVNFGDPSERILTNNARDTLQPAGWGPLQPANGAVAAGTLVPAGDVQVQVDAPNFGVRDVRNVFPAGAAAVVRPSPVITAEQIRIAQADAEAANVAAHAATEWWRKGPYQVAVGAGLVALVGTGLYLWMRKPKTNPYDWHSGD